MSAVAKRKSEALARILRIRKAQAVVRWGSAYEPAIKAVTRQAPQRSNAGSLPAPRLGRKVHYVSGPEKKTGALALYANPFELHQQHAFYPQRISHPLAFHPVHGVHQWPCTDGTMAIAQKLGLAQYHPRAWVDSTSDGEDGHWEIGAWIGDYLLYLVDDLGPYSVFWSVRASDEDHGKPGGSLLNRFKPNLVAKERARDTICAAYVDQLDSRIVNVSADQIPDSLASTLVFLCLSQEDQSVHLLSAEATNDLLQAFQEGMGQDKPANEIARQVVSSPEHLRAAKALMQIAAWERVLRVDLYEPLLWDRPLRPEHQDILQVYAPWLRRTG